MNTILELGLQEWFKGLDKDQDKSNHTVEITERVKNRATHYQVKLTFTEAEGDVTNDYFFFCKGKEQLLDIPKSYYDWSGNVVSFQGEWVMGHETTSFNDYLKNKYSRGGK